MKYRQYREVRGWISFNDLSASSSDQAHELAHKLLIDNTRKLFIDDHRHDRRPPSTATIIVDVDEIQDPEFTGKVKVELLHDGRN